MDGGEVDANPGHRSDQKIKSKIMHFDDDENLQTEGQSPLQSPVTFSAWTIDRAIPSIDEEPNLPPTLR